MNASDIIFYTTPQGEVRIEVFFENETFWLSQKKIAELFDKDVRTVNEHLANVFQEGELTPAATIRKFRIVQREGNRDVERERVRNLALSSSYVKHGVADIPAFLQALEALLDATCPHGQVEMRYTTQAIAWRVHG